MVQVNRRATYVNVTAKGSPSGTATTTIVTAIVIIFITSFINILARVFPA